MAHQIDVTHQNVIVARLADFCRWSNRVSQYESDPWSYMKFKIQEMERPIAKLKQDQLMAAGDAFLARLRHDQVAEASVAEFKTAIHGYLLPGDYVDIASNLIPEAIANPGQQDILRRMIRSMRAISLFEEERETKGRPAAKAGQLIEEIFHRLGFDMLRKVLVHKPLTPRRKRMILRRIRRNVAEYCTVLHVSFDPRDTFSPFMLLRVEALLVACLRLLDPYF